MTENMPTPEARKDSKVSNFMLNLTFSTQYKEKLHLKTLAKFLSLVYLLRDIVRSLPASCFRVKHTCKQVKGKIFSQQ